MKPERTCPTCNVPLERFGEPLGDWRDQCDDCRDVEVSIQFDISKMNVEQRRAIYAARCELNKLGVTFDIGTNGAVIDWEWDWSLRGPVRVLLKQRTRDNPRNRYTRANQEKQHAASDAGKRVVEAMAEELTLKVN